ncbi:MAG: hypothetical protein JJU36_14715 [Phycisphaeraceae bacterium]|nr:hypothetical protein [Phycisphaeraceae bacterium]
MKPIIEPMKTSIIGIGKVGATLAYTLMLRGLADDLVLVSRHRRQAEGEAMDIQHASAFVDHSVSVRAGDLPDTANSGVVVMCRSVPWEPHFKSRMELARGNVRIFAQLIPELARLSPEAVFVVVTNPVDVMTWHAIRMSGLPARQVIGTGTLIDSGRLRSRLSEEMQIHPDDLRAYILGEHGDGQFAALSSAAAGGQHIEPTPRIRGIADEIANAGTRVLELKGHTCYAISVSTALIIHAVVHNLRQTIPVSTLIDDDPEMGDVCLSVPAVVGAGGIQRLLKPALNEAERRLMRYCARIVREGIDRSLAEIEA